MAGRRAEISERLAGNRDELPVERAAGEREGGHAPDSRMDLAVRANKWKLVERRASGADDELAHAASGIEPSVWILRSETLVDVIVAVDHEIDIELVQRAPQITQVGIVAVLARREERTMPDGRGAERSL